MDYSLRKSAEICHVCEHAFAAAERFFSLIVLADEEPVRMDLCAGCFEERETPREREFAFWKTTHAEAEQSRRLVDFNTLRELFFRMADQHSEQYRVIRYLLGLVLIRKRFIRLREFVSREGADYLVVTATQRPEAIMIEAPEIRPEAFAALKDRLRMLLDMDLGEEADLAMLAPIEPGPGAADEEHSGPLEVQTDP